MFFTNYKKIKGYFFFAGVIILISYVCFFSAKNYPFLKKEVQNYFLFHFGEFGQVFNSLKEKKLDEEGYLKVQTSLQEAVLEENPTNAFSYLRSLVQSGKAGSDCHNLTHDIGRAAYDKYNDMFEAFKYEEQLCGYGYIHGVIEEYIEKTNKPLINMRTLCERGSSEREKMECYHATGHSFMIFHGYNYNKALKDCNDYNNNAAKAICGQGVFMELFSQKQIENMDEKTIFHPCIAVNLVYKADCYKMAPHYYLNLKNNEFSGILEWCKTAPKPYEYWCVRGVSLQLIQYPIKIVNLEKFCVSGDHEQVQPCIEEIVRNKSLYHPEEVALICEKILKNDYTKQICSNYVELEKNLDTK